jgi:hypothetical protein
MGFKTNPDGSKTWTNSSGTYSYTREKNGQLRSTTSSLSNGYSKTTSYSGGRVSGTSTTYSNGKTIKR